jgi:hypothetical protein
VGTTDTVISIETADELRKIGTNASYPMTGVYYRLMNDIDLSDANWTGIGLNTSTGTLTGFGGTFDGQGHTISNMHAYGATKSSAYEMPAHAWGLFCTGAQGAVVKNVLFENVVFNGNYSSGSNCAVGTVMGYTNVKLTMQNVAVVSGSISASSGRQTRVGGLLGCARTVKGGTVDTAGIIIKDCFNGALVTGTFNSVSGARYVSVA